MSKTKSKRRGPGEASREADVKMRRSFLKVGIAAIPVILTLKAAPVRAQDSGGGSLGVYGYGNAATDESTDDTSRQWKRVDQ